MVKPAGQKRKREAANAENEMEMKLLLKCEWEHCIFDTTNLEEFVNHVENHEPQRDLRDENEEEAERPRSGQSCSEGPQETMSCLWTCCYFTSSCALTTRFHINYHAYHTKIKAIGTTMMKRNMSMNCYQDPSGRNYLPPLPSERPCEWEGCEFITSNFQRLVTHCNRHVTGQPHRRDHETVQCLWAECYKPCKDMTKLKSHLRSHTQLKAVACPVCGVQFANTTKFKDHCGRQSSQKERVFKCSYCKKTFSSERILQDHFRVHIHLHKCTMCDMTSPNKSALVKHIQIKHVKERPFSCNFCNYRATLERDLKTHYLSHSKENYWKCNVDGCDFSARSRNGLQAHIPRAHGGKAAEYGCHICEATFSRGGDLTVHLKKMHAYRWASGQSRFRYTQDDSGIYRLQMIRYESLEVAQQIEENATIRKLDRRRKFTITSKDPCTIEITEEGNKRSTHTADYSDSDNVDDDLSSREETSVEEASPKRMSLEGTGNEYDAETDIDDPEEPLQSDPAGFVLMQTETDPVQLETDVDDSETDEFAESLKQHLGLRDGFIRVVKP